MANACAPTARRAKQARLPVPPTWWSFASSGDEVKTREVVRARLGERLDWQCIGHRQSYSAFSADAAELRAALRLFAPSVAARADEVWRTHVAPSAPSGAFFVALYHRVAAREAQYRACLPGRAFYVAARARLRSHVDATHGAGTPIVWLTSSYEFGDRAAIDTLLGAAPDDAAREPLLALDDLDGSVVMATLARANASTFSFGTFSWWTAFLTGGPVLYDASLRDTTSLEVSGCAELVRGGARDAVLEKMADEHLPAEWTPIDTRASPQPRAVRGRAAASNGAS